MHHNVHHTVLLAEISAFLSILNVKRGWQCFSKK